MANQFKTHLYKILEKDSRLWNEETKEFNETLLKDLIDKLDEKIIELLLDDKETKEKFFVKMKDVYVLKQSELKFFIDENKLDNSYTQYQNKIGIRIGNKLLSERDEVVLNWPFKDCVLEGGMTKEDQKRNEIFFNEVLAKDEIDRLYEPKVLVNWQRYNKDGGEKVKELKRDENGTIKENLIIKGNNLLALASLKKEFAGKVKLIYIDPPYNTGNDGFKYNDNFNHSTWLTFMKNRLEVAKELLRDDGVIFVQCDDNEQAYLKVLMDDIEKLKFINCITVKMNESKGLKNAHIEKRLPKSKEYILIYSKNNFLFNPQKIEKDKEELLGYIKYYNKQIINFEKDISLWKIENFSEPIENRISNAEKLIYLVKPDNDIKIHLEENTFGKIINSRGVENYYFNDGRNILKVLFLGQNLHKYIGDLWLDISTININKEGGMQVFSNGQKPEKLLQRIIEMSTEKEDIVLDYHLGSGTTCAVAHKKGRQYIGIEQLDYGENDSVIRIQNVINGDQSGISKSVNWKDGGDFVYVELAKWNEEAKKKILKTKNLDELEKLFGELYEQYFLNYNVKTTKIFKEKILQEEEFKKLSLDEQKSLFIEMLDMNQMYVNFTERSDKKYNISKEDIALSEQFYNTTK